MKRMLQDARPGLWLSLAAAALALAGGLAYVVIYLAAAGEAVDRVFSWLTLGLALGGAAITLAGEGLRLSFTPILGGACFAVALANHLVETAYPLADVLTGVPFFGGNPALAIAFSVVFGLAAVLNVIGAFLPHRK
ncbi:MAG: hypothetical protein K2P49_09810 [Oscillospiraceae bacterium]|nr:hypothetical protein [Oscillospiraceae bacterium]